MVLFQDNAAMVADLQSRLGRQFQFSPGQALCQITTPFLYPSGARINVLVSRDPQSPNDFRVDDLGTGAAELKDRLGYDQEAPLEGHLNHLFNQTCNRYDVTMDATNNEMETVSTTTDHHNLPAAICHVIQASLMAAYVEE